MKTNGETGLRSVAFRGDRAGVDSAARVGDLTPMRNVPTNAGRLA